MTIADEFAGWLDSLSDIDIQERRQAALKRKARAEIALNRLGADARKIETRRKIVVGAAVMALARREPDFARQLRFILDSELTASRDRIVVGLDPKEAL